jgi:putative tryptophan/tyrosine transport system substrate-binding protein
MSKKMLIWSLTTILLTAAFPAEAQQKKAPRIGYLSALSASATARAEAFRQGLRELGYIEGQNIVIEYRFAEGKLDQVPRNAAELVRLKVDVIVTAGSTDTAAARKATATIPIVMTQDNDPVGSGFVTALARPGGNITGLTNISSELGWNCSKRSFRGSPA